VRDEGEVLGDEAKVVGNETESASLLIKTMFGPPYDEIRDIDYMMDRAIRRVSYTVKPMEGLGMPMSIHIEMYQRNDKILAVTILDENDEPLDLTGATIHFVVESIGIHKKTGDGIKVIDVKGQIEIEITNADTDAPSGNYSFEILVVDVEGHRYTVATGIFSLYRSLVGQE